MLITCLPFVPRDRLRLKPFFFQLNTWITVRLVGSQSWSPANNQCPLTARGGLKCRVWRGNIKTSIKPNWSLKYHNCTTFSIVINYWTSANPPPPLSTSPRKLTDIMYSVPHVVDTFAPGLASSATDGLTERYQQRQRRSCGHHWTNKGFSQKYKISQAPTVWLRTGNYIKWRLFYYNIPNSLKMITQIYTNH